MMHKRISFMIVLLLSFSLMGCESKTEDTSSLSISYNVTTQIGAEDFNTDIFLYSFKDQKSTKIMSLPDNTANPLAVYHEDEDVVYYRYWENGTTQLYKKDVKTSKETKLTDSLFAINYIIPTQDTIYVVAAENGERAAGLFAYDGSMKRILEDKDAFVSQVNMNLSSQKLVFNTYSQAEVDENMQTQTPNERVAMGINSIYTIDLKGDRKIEKVAETKAGEMLALNVDNKGQIHYLMDYAYTIDKNGDSIKEDSMKEKYIGEVEMETLLYESDEEIYYINDGNLCNFNRKTKEIRYIYENTGGKEALNTAIVLQKKVE